MQQARTAIKTKASRLSGRPAADTRQALQQAGGDVTLDIVEDLGHAIDDRSMQLAIERLRYTVPKHYFDEALSGSTPKGDDIIEML